MLECGNSTEEKSMTPQFDVYSLAATVYYSITGIEPPVNGTLKKPSELGVTIEKFQENALLKGLASDYKKRYPSVKEFMTALNQDTTQESEESTRKVIVTIFLLAGNLFIIGTLLLYEIILINDRDSGSWLINLYDFIATYDTDFSVALLVEIVSSICLFVFISDILQIYKGRKPQYLNSIFLQDVASLIQIICVFLFVFIIFFYYESWDEGFIWEFRISIFLNLKIHPNTADLLVNFGVLIYIVNSIVAVIFGR